MARIHKATALHSYPEIKVLDAGAADCLIEDPKFVVWVGNSALVASADGIARNIPDVTRRRVNKSNDLLIGYILNLTWAWLVKRMDRVQKQQERT